MTKPPPPKKRGPHRLPPATSANQRSKRPKHLPPLVDILDLIAEDLPRPAELVHGILHRGSKMVIGGGSKSFKTWTLVDLAVSVAAGVPWWGFDTTQGRVLYMNFEIQDVFFANRAWEVMTAKSCELADGQLTYWGLRGKAANLASLMDELVSTLQDGDYSLIIIDPIYKALGDRDENKAGDIASLLNNLEALAVQTGAAVAFGHHFSKGLQAGKESIDRMSGSGVFARDPDTILTMTPHKETEAFTVDAILRNFPPVDQFVVERQHPLMVRNDNHDPAELKKPGAVQKYSNDEILAPLKDGAALSKKEWFEAVKAATNISHASFANRTAELARDGVVAQVGDGKRTDPWALSP